MLWGEIVLYWIKRTINYAVYLKMPQEVEFPELEINPAYENQSCILQQNGESHPT